MPTSWTALLGWATTENEFNKRGDEGWEFVAVAQDYAIFKRPKS